MAAPTTPPADPFPVVADGTLLRFDRTERNVHWFTAALVGTCLATAAALSMTALAVVIGRRAMVKDVHVLAGLSLPLPMVIGWVVGRRGSGLREDVRRLNRYDEHDRRWLRSLGRDPFVRNGKFNGGQKLNAAFVCGALLLLLASGSIMKWFGPFPLAWRTGATFVHDWTAWLLTIALVGHVAKAFGDRHALSAMRQGTISRRWAARHAPRWLDELDR
jgi:formate dehydrogenase subunit gamma